VTAPKPFDRVVYHGKLMDEKTKAFVQAMEEKLGYELTIVQGSYNPGGVSQSAGTHDGGGVLDLAAYDWRTKVRVAADLGAFVWRRPYIAGLWGEHVHLGIRDHGRLSSSAQRQQQDWDARPPRNGLASHAPMGSGDYHPGKVITFKYPPTPEVVVPQPTRVTKARDELVQAIHSIGEAAALLDATPDSREAAHAPIAELKTKHRELRQILKSLPKR
jgi:hypothetical protein